MGAGNVVNAWQCDGRGGVIVRVGGGGMGSGVGGVNAGGTRILKM